MRTFFMQVFLLALGTKIPKCDDVTWKHRDQPPCNPLRMIVFLAMLNPSFINF